MALTAGRLAREFNMSRTALLYYDEIGLVKPSGRSRSGYRLYSEEDRQRLKTALTYRDAGISLDEIIRLLSGAGGSLEAVLLKRLDELNREIARIKARQAAVIRIIQDVAAHGAPDGRQSWRMGLEEAGIVGEEADRLHKDFEEHSPQLHGSFLAALGFAEAEIAMIREHYHRKQDGNQ